MKRTLSLIVLCLTSQFLFAQSSNNMKWGKISQADLEMTIYTPDSSANAVVLNDKTKGDIVYFPGKVVYHLDRHMRIKVLTKAGMDQGDITLTYYNFQDKEKLKGLKAQVIHPDGTKYKLNDDHIFESQISKYYKETRLSFPNLVEGCIIEYKYTIQSQHFFTLRPWEFQREIPVRDASLDMRLPDELEYVQISKGEEYIQRNKHCVYVNEVPSMTEEPYITTMDDYLGKIEFQLKTIGDEPFFSTWEKVSKELSKHKEFGGQVKDRKIKPMIQAAEGIFEKADDMTLNELVGKLSDVVYDHMTWNGEYDFTVDQDLKECLKIREGNSAAMNLALLTLIRKAGYTAYPMLVSTRDHGQMYPFYPFLSQFNHTMVYMKYLDQTHLFDLSTKAKPHTLPQANSLNGYGLAVYKNDAKIVSLPVYASVSYLKMDAEISEALEITGSVNCTYKNHVGIEERKKYIDEDAKEVWEQRLGIFGEEVEVNDVVAEELDNVTEKFKESFEFSVSEKVEELDDLLLVNTNVYFPIKENPFKAEERTYPIDVNYPQKFILIMDLKIPEGYMLDSAPEGIKANIPNGSLGFRNVLSQKGQNLNIVRELDFKVASYSPEEYEIIKGFFEVLIERLEEPIVLKKMP